MTKQFGKDSDQYLISDLEQENKELKSRVARLARTLSIINTSSVAPYLLNDEFKAEIAELLKEPSAQSLAIIQAVEGLLDWVNDATELLQAFSVTFDEYSGVMGIFDDAIKLSRRADKLRNSVKDGV